MCGDGWLTRHTVVIITIYTNIESLCVTPKGNIVLYAHLKNHSCLEVMIQFSSVAQFCSTLCDPMDKSTPGLPVHHQLLELAQTHVH